MLSTFTTGYSDAAVTGSGTNMLNEQTEFALPAFLQYKAGLEFCWHKQIARGGGGAIYLGVILISKLKEFGSTIIVKILGNNRQELPQIMNTALDQEVSVMHYLGRHKNIAGLLGWCEEPVAMLMKYYQLGSLESVVKSHS